MTQIIPQQPAQRNCKAIREHWHMPEGKYNTDSGMNVNIWESRMITKKMLVTQKRAVSHMALSKYIFHLLESLTNADL
jgi:hypothetical protein